MDWKDSLYNGRYVSQNGWEVLDKIKKTIYYSSQKMDTISVDSNGKYYFVLSLQNNIPCLKRYWDSVEVNCFATNLRQLAYKNLQFWPNPVVDFLKIKLPFATNENLRVSVSDMQGKSVNAVSARVSEDEIHVKFEKITSGLYFIRLNSNGIEYYDKYLVH